MPESNPFPPPDLRATQLLQRMAQGEAELADELFGLVREELRRIAGALMSRERQGHTLQATALVHEAWMRLSPEDDSSPIECRSHFLRLASRAMRSVLVDHARRRNAVKRGGGQDALLLLEEPPDQVSGPAPLEILALDEALRSLEERDEGLARLVEMRFFGGLTTAEVAQALDQTPRQVEGSWAFARSWLKRELERDGAHG